MIPRDAPTAAVASSSSSEAEAVRAEFEGISLEEYVADWRTAWIVERALAVAAGAVPRW